MKAFGLAASIVALMSSGAIAADAHDKGSTKDGGDSSGPVVVNWTGLYIGGSVGYGNANHNLSLHDFWKDYCTETPGMRALSRVKPHSPSAKMVIGAKTRTPPLTPEAMRSVTSMDLTPPVS